MAVLFIAAYYLESISKDLALLGCTAGTTICFILPSIIYLRCLDDADRAKVSPSTLRAWSWGSVCGRRNGGGGEAVATALSLHRTTLSQRVTQS